MLLADSAINVVESTNNNFTNISMTNLKGSGFTLVGTATNSTYDHIYMDNIGNYGFQCVKTTNNEICDYSNFTKVKNVY